MIASRRDARQGQGSRCSPSPVARGFSAGMLPLPRGLPEGRDRRLPHCLKDLCAVKSLVEQRIQSWGCLLAMADPSLAGMAWWQLNLDPCSKASQGSLSRRANPRSPCHLPSITPVSLDATGTRERRLSTTFWPRERSLARKGCDADPGQGNGQPFPAPPLPQSRRCEAWRTGWGPIWPGGHGSKGGTQPTTPAS